MQVSIQPLLNSDDGEKAKTKTVKQKERDPEFFVEIFYKKCQHCSQENDSANKDVVHPEDRNPEKQVPYGTTSYGSRESNNKDTKWVETFLHGCKGTRHGKCNGSENFDSEIKILMYFQNSTGYLYADRIGDKKFIIAVETDDFPNDTAADE